jgi:hypothetical protein
MTLSVVVGFVFRHRLELKIRERGVALCRKNAPSSYLNRIKQQQKRKILLTNIGVEL